MREPCSCGRPFFAHGLCKPCYDRSYRAGILPPRPTTEERFWAKVNKTETCWLWTAQIDADGYGHFRWDGKRGAAHRFAYEYFIGPIPNGLQLDHLCRTRACVNPAHLEPVTCRENLLRGATFQSANALKTHCQQGHPFDDENTYITANGSRACKACRRRWCLESYYRRKGRAS